MNKLYWQQIIAKRRPDLGVVVLITGVFVFFFAPVLFTGKIFVINDAFIYSYPLRSIAFDQIRHGSLPLWTSQLMSGYPLLSMSQLGIGYPLTWSYLFLPGYIAEEIYVFAPFLLGPVFMYCWIRTIGPSRLAALFAALAFAYGGMMASPIAHSGILTNTMMWLPLILIQIEKARTGNFARSVFWGTVCYSLSVLAGSGQAIVMVTTVVVGYGLFISLMFRRVADVDASRRWLGWARWQPFAVSLSAVLLGSSMGAFQILESMKAQELSIRSTLPYEIFSEGFFSPLLAVKSLVAPLYYQTDVSTYVVPLAVLLALWALISLLPGPSRDLRIVFWLLIAVWSWIWMLGPTTPFYPLLYRVPLLNKFRVPSRHSFEWTFAVATLSAYGWDALADRITRTSAVSTRVERTKLTIGLLSLGAAVAVAWLWWQSTLRLTVSIDSDPRLLFRFMEWKLLFTCLVLIPMWLGARLRSSTQRTTLLIAATMIACLVEPATAASYWWWTKLKTPDRFRADAIATRVLKEKNRNGDRVYTHSSIWAEEYAKTPRIDPPNISALHNLRDVGGYEPLFLQRYSQALGNVTLDGVYPRPGESFDDMMFSSGSHVLDLLNTRFAVSYANLSTIPDNLHEKDGIKFFIYDSYFVVKPGERKKLSAAAKDCDGFAWVTALGHGAGEPNGTTVAKLHFRTADGRLIERDFRAGTDTAEWSIENPEIAGTVQHERASVFDSHPAAEGPFTAYRFWSLSHFDQRVKLETVEIENVSSIAEVLVWKVSLYDSITRRSYPLPTYDEQKWRPVYDADNILILENQSFLPRAWLVAEAEVVESDDALRRIRGDSDRPFDPRRTVLIERASELKPDLAGGQNSTTAHAEVVKEKPGSIIVDASTDKQSMLIVSETNYPGWQATLDSRPVPIYTADYLLQGVEIPPGTHRVVLEYAAPRARRGAMISVIALGVTIGLGLSLKRKDRKPDSTSQAG